MFQNYPVFSGLFISTSHISISQLLKEMWTGILHFVCRLKAIQNRKLKYDPSEYSFQSCERIREKKRREKNKREKKQWKRMREKERKMLLRQRYRESQGGIRTHKYSGHNSKWI